MTPSPVLNRCCDWLARRILTLPANILPHDRHNWSDALLAETGAIHSPGERVRFAMAGGLALARIGVADALRGRVADPSLIAAASALGLIAAAIDLHAGSRLELRLLLGLGCFGMGFAAPRGAWRWGLLAGLGLPLLAAISGTPGPYAFDRGDVWFPLPPAVALAVAGAVVASRLRPPRDHFSAPEQKR